jgi:hypothetical protein
LTISRQPDVEPGPSGANISPARQNLWRLYALACLIPLTILVDLLVGPSAQKPFEPLMAVDFGAFYAAATMVRDGDARDLGEMETQRAAQTAVQEKADTGWRWYNAFPYPPVTSLFTAPLAGFSLVTAYWIWVALGLLAGGVASWLLARAFCPAIVSATTLILISFEPLWDVAWWGQIDSLLLLPVAGSVVLLRAPDRLSPATRKRRELLAGLLLGFLAIKPIFVPLPLLVLAWGRPRVAIGMIASGLALALTSLALVGIDGIGDYIDLARFYQAYSGSPAIVEWRMYNLRGAAIRLGWSWSEDVQLAVVLTLSVILALATLILSARALRLRRSPDLVAAAVTLGTILTAYHVHVQSLVFLAIPLAIWLRRSLQAPSNIEAVAWALPVIAIHAGAALLRPQLPSPAVTETRLETLLTTACLLALLGTLLVLYAGQRFPRKAATVAESGIPA